MRGAPVAFALCVACLGLVVSGGGVELRAGVVADPRLDALEVRLTGEPGNLRLGAEYRQIVIATGQYDRSIHLFDRLSKDSRAGANGFLNLALACVDKVPVSGELRQALLGRDIINATTRSIAREPTMVAYLIRGLVNLYYNHAIFHRADKGVADLERALALAARQPDVPAVRVFIALGDGYWRLNRSDEAHATWRAGLSRYPGDEALRARIEGSSDRIDHLVDHALDPNVRVDTTLRELFPDLIATIKSP
jgi:hypothetical protein